MPGSGDLRILSSIENSDPDLSREIKEKLFSMTDILKADDRFIQKKLQEMEDASIAYLIAGKSEAFRLKILGNISKGRKALVLEEENMRKPMKKRDVDEVTLAFFTLLRKAWENGELILHDSSDILVY
jgi:flagellar motor switch protein FliG